LWVETVLVVNVQRATAVLQRDKYSIMIEYVCEMLTKLRSL